MIDSSNPIQVEASAIVDGAALGGSSSANKYVSPWTADSNATSHNVLFQHGLGVIPSSLLVQFSVDLNTVYPVLWNWNSPNVVGNGGNPVSIWMDDGVITLSIVAFGALHGWWNGQTGQWTSANSGFWRVIATATIANRRTT